MNFKKTGWQLSPAEIRELKSRIADLHNPVRYVIYSDLSQRTLATLSQCDLMRDSIGNINSGIPDLAGNPNLLKAGT